MSFIKKNIKWIIGIIIGIVVASGISVYATGQYYATQINYTRNNETVTVAEALNYLYGKTNSTYNIAKWNLVSIGSEAYGSLHFPDLTDYKTLTIDSVNLQSGTFQYLEFRDKDGNVITSFSKTSSVQTFDISAYSGMGYILVAYATSMSSWNNFNISNIALSK